MSTKNRFLQVLFFTFIFAAVVLGSILSTSQSAYAASPDSDWTTSLRRAAFSVTESAFSCNTTIRIMPLGDSITHGVYGSDSFGGSGDPRPDAEIPGYRQPLYQLLTNAGHQVEFVGKLQAGQDIVPSFDADHNGYRGKSDDYIADRIYGFLETDPADIILLHIGTNKLNDSPDDVEKILNEIDRYENDFNSDITVVLARIINRSSTSKSGDRQTTTDFNDNVETMAQARIAAGDDIIIVDMENGAGIDYRIQPEGDMADDLHPYDSGYDKMAQAWYDVLSPILPDCPAGAGIYSEPVTPAYLNQLYNYDVNATGSPAVTYSLTTAPNGMSIDSDSGLISWTPSQTGSVEVVIAAANSNGTDSQSYTLEVVTVPPTPAPSPNPTTINCDNVTVLFIGSSNPLPSRDQLLVDHLEAAGLSVVVKDQNEATTADAGGKNLVIISDSISSGNVNTKFRDVAVPVITWESGLFDDMQLASDADFDTKQTQITITDSSHPLAAGLSGTVTTVSSGAAFFWGVPAANAIQVASLATDSSKVAIFGYDTGDPMVGMNAPARRLAFYNGDADLYTTEAWQLFDAAVVWALNCSEAPTARDDEGVTDEDTSISLTVLNNDTDPDDDSLNVAALGTPQDGQATTNGVTVVYTPTLNFNGIDVFTYTVSDGKGGEDSATITVTVNAVNDAPVLTTIDDQMVDEGQTLTFNAFAIDPDFPDDLLTFSLVGAPSGASINSGSGVFNWTPSPAQGPGVYTATVVVADKGVPSPVLTDSQEIKITVVNQLPVIPNIEDQTVNEGETLSVTLRITDTSGISFSIIDPPTGVTVEPITSDQIKLEWTPTEQQGPGVYTPSIVIEDQGAPGTTFTQTFTITVNEVNQAPVLAPIGAQTVQVDKTLSFIVTGTDADEPKNELVYTTSDAPTGASLNSSSGAFSWTPTEVGVYTATVIVSDDGQPSLTDTETITIEVVADRPTQPQPQKIFLPLITTAADDGSSAPPNRQPDLQATLTIEPDASELSATEEVVLKVTVKNSGTATAAPNFWVDLYVNPLPFPNEAGHVWSDLCATSPNPSTNPCLGDYGIAWQILEPVEPGEVIQLTSKVDDPYISKSPHTVWSGFLPVGSHELWVYVDSWNGYDVPQGFIVEESETNNRVGPINVKVVGSSSSADQLSTIGLDGSPIPPRPLP